MRPARKRNPRRGLQRLSCGCGASVWQTWAAVERGPRPVCGCGTRFVPDDLELAAAVCDTAELDAHEWHGEYARQLSSVLHGQASHVQRGNNVRGVEAVAYERVQKARRAAAKQSQLSGLRRPAADPIPF